MSWQWQSRWWRLHGASLRAELYLLAAYADDGTLIGLAPLYRYEAAHRWVLRARRLEMIGSAFRGANPLTFSEYLDFIVDRSQEEAVLQALCARILADPAWSDFVLANTRLDGLAMRAAVPYLSRECYVRQQDRLAAHVLPLPERFEEYLEALKPGVRRKVWNRRSHLKSALFRFAGERDIEEVLRQIGRFQSARWGASTAQRNRLGFHRGLASAMAQEDALRMSILLESGEPISLMYNIEIDGTEYNLQSAFNPRAAALSPSYLHFGYCLESAAERGVRAFDFLAGSGRTRNYKRDFGTREVHLATVQAIRDPWLQRLYRLYDGAPSWVRGVAGTARRRAQPDS